MSHIKTISIQFGIDYSIADVSMSCGAAVKVVQVGEVITSESSDFDDAHEVLAQRAVERCLSAVTEALME
jgi:hypothetical protein